MPASSAASKIDMMWLPDSVKTRSQPTRRSERATISAPRKVLLMFCVGLSRPARCLRACGPCAKILTSVRSISNSPLDRAVDAAVDDDGLAGEVAGLRRAEIGAEIADFVRPSHAAHRNGFGEALEQRVGRYARALRPRGQYFGEAIGHDGAGRDIVDGDAVRREIRGDGLGHDRDTGAN